MDANRIFWNNWLKNKTIDWQLGQEVSRKLREEINKKIDLVENEMCNIREENNHLSLIKEVLVKMKLLESNSEKIAWYHANEIINNLENIGTGFDKEFRNALSNLEAKIAVIKKHIGAI